MIPTLTHLYTQMNKSMHNGTIPGSMDGGGGGEEPKLCRGVEGTEDIWELQGLCLPMESRSKASA